jgi:hypothetical protein
MKKNLHLLLFLCLISLSGFAQTAKYSNEFLAIGVGAESFGMANASIAHIDNVTSGYWNPAGLNGIDNGADFGVMHAEYFAGIAKYDYAAGAMAIDSGQWLGASLIRFGVDDIPNTTELIDNQGNVDYDRISYFSAADYAFLMSYAKATGIKNLYIGGNAKVIYRNIGKFANAWGFGLDIGAQYKTRYLDFGLVIRDVTSTFNAWSYNEEELVIEVGDSTFNEAPDNNLEITMPTIVLGAAYQFNITEKIGGLIATDAQIHTDGQRHSLVSSDFVSVSPQAGLELNYNKLVYLRMGIGNLQHTVNINGIKTLEFQPNLGIGFQYKGFAIDYALTDIGDQSVALYSNIFSLRYTFNKNEN